MSMLAIDLETKNMSYDIVYVDEPVESFAKSGHIVKSLSELKYDLDNHFQKGGLLLGHNIKAFDLPILRDSMDIYCINKYIKEEQFIDTSKILFKEHGERFPLSNLVKCTMNDFKLMDSADAPKLWKMGQYDEVVEYCMKDTQLVYDLWKYGQDNGIVKAFSVNKEEFVELEVNW